MSNYGVHHLDELESYIKELEDENGKGKGGEISVGQWELHPWLTRPDIVEWCNKRGVICEAYCPIVRGERFGDSKLQTLVKKYDKTPAQILLRWSLQKVIVDFLNASAKSYVIGRGLFRCPNQKHPKELKRTPISTTLNCLRKT